MLNSIRFNQYFMKILFKYIRPYRPLVLLAFVLAAINQTFSLFDPMIFGKLIDWRNINELIPSSFKSGSKYKTTGKAGIFAGSLELVKEGNLTIKQENLFDDIYIKELK